MKPVNWVFFCAVVTAAFSAPVIEDEQSRYTDIDSSQLDYMSGKRSNNQLYAIPPCAAAAASVPVEVPLTPQYPIPAKARYIPNTYDYAYSEYPGNAVGLENPYSDGRELLGYSDGNFNDQPGANRYLYRSASYIPINAGHLGAPASYGVFPSAKIGDCNIPLLVSCTPSVVTGHMVKPETHVYSAAPIAVAHPDGGNYLQRIHSNQEQAAHNKLVAVNNGAMAHSSDKLP